MDDGKPGIYLLNIGRFIEDHPGHVIESPRGIGYQARRKKRGRAVGPAVYALTLDELAGLIRQQPRRLGKLIR